MGPKLIFLGDEATAAGLRLAGVEAHVIEQEAVEQAYDLYAPTADVLLLGAVAAKGLPRDRLERDLLRTHPLLMLLPDPSSEVFVESPANLIRQRLGIRDESGQER